MIFRNDFITYRTKNLVKRMQKLYICNIPFLVAISKIKNCNWTKWLSVRL